MTSISVIIPTLTGIDTALTDALRSQTLPPDEIEVVRGVRPNGRARNQGAARTQGDILVFIDDDARPASPRLIEKLVEPLLSDATIGATGASRLIPPDSSRFQRWAARQVPRVENPVVRAPVESRPGPENYFFCDITTTCCAMPRPRYDEIGGFDEELVQGVDTDFFIRMSRAGLRMVLVPDLWVYHPAPPDLAALVRKHFRYGYGHAQAVRRDPSRARRLERHPWLYLLLRSLLLVPHVFLPFSYAEPMRRLGFRPLKAIAGYSSAVGYVWGRWRARERRGPV